MQLHQANPAKIHCKPKVPSRKHNSLWLHHELKKNHWPPLPDTSQPLTAPVAAVRDEQGQLCTSLNLLRSSWKTKEEKENPSLPLLEQQI